MKKKFLIIGGSYVQIPLIDTARDLGFDVITVDANPDAPAMKISDEPVVIDTRDALNILKLARERNVQGVITTQSDSGVESAALVVDELKLVGPSLKTAHSCLNKIETRMILRKHSIVQPEFLVIKNIKDAVKAGEILGYPFIIKAPDSSGSRGVVKVKSKNELNFALSESKKYTKQDSLLAEKYISGTEIGAQALSVDGECKKIYIHNDIMSTTPFMIPIGHSFPSRLELDLTRKIDQVVKKVLKALGLENGPSNIDLIVGEDNEIYVLEIGARIGATCLPELIKFHSGVDWNRVAVEIALGLPPTIKEHECKTPSAALILESPYDGIFKGAEIIDLLSKNPCLLDFEITAKDGDKVNRLRKGTDRIGKIIVKGDSASAAESLAWKLRDSILFKVSQSQDFF